MQSESDRLQKWFDTDLREKLSKPKAFLAFNNLRLYVNGVSKQWSRIRSLSEQIFEIPFDSLKEGSEERRLFLRLQQARELDIHFYLTCWDGVRKHYKDFVRKDGDPEIRKAWGDVWKLLESIKPVRHFFEHLDERDMQGKGFQFTRSGTYFRVSYFERGAKPSENKWVSLGNQEVELLNRAFDRVVSVIQARRRTPFPKDDGHP